MIKSKFSAGIVTGFLIIFAIVFQSFAQAPDTVDVPYIIDDNPMGAINKFILGDTTATGERNNINRVYRLGRGFYYFFDSIMEVRFPLTLIAEEDDPNNPTPPPLLAPGILQDNSSPEDLIWAYDNLTFKNLHITGVRPDEDRLNWDIAVSLLGDNCKYVFDNCIFEGWGWSSIRQFSSFAKIFITDCRFRNNMHPTSFLGGSGYISQAGAPTDTVIMTNNTFFASGSYFFCPNREYTTYSLVEHNTIFTNHGPVFYAPWVHNAFYKNNIIYGTFAMGQYEPERAWHDFDNQFYSIVSLDTMPTDIASREGIAEADRVVEFENNVYFWPQKMIDFWAGADSLDPALWINERTQAMLDDDTNYPGLKVEGNMNVDPGFNADMMAQVDSLMKYCIQNRGGGINTYSHYYYGEGNPPLFFPAQRVWSLPEDLTYSNTDLLTASTDGLPLGDLNWYPDKKAEWEDIQTGIRSKEPVTKLSDFTLSQNYPNPFNPETNIQFTLKKNAQVKINVYDMLGQKVKTLVDKKMTAGTHMVTWNGLDNKDNKLASGIYYYRLESESFSKARKMVMLK